MKKQKMFDLISAWEKSDQTMEQFSAAHGIKRGTFAYWRGKYKREHSRAFTEITPDSSSKHSIELIFPSGVKMMVSRADVGFIRSIIQ